MSQNTYRPEEIIGKFWEEFLNRELLDTWLEARLLTAYWRWEYNVFRPELTASGSRSDRIVVLGLSPIRPR